MKFPDPPRWADHFLKWYCNPAFLEEIQGDIYELFDRRVEQKGLTFARLRFVWDVLRFFRWSNIKRSRIQNANRTIMLSNYFKIGIRNIERNLLISSINILGLSLAIGCLITTFIFIDLQFNMDSYHQKGDRIYQILNHVQEEDRMVLWGDSPLLIGPDLASNHSAVASYTRVEYSSGNVRVGDKVLSQYLSFVDPTYLEIFDFPILYGNKQALYDPAQIVLSYDMYVRFFGDVNPLGHELTIKYSNGQIKTYFVGGVLDKYPGNTSIRMNALIPMSSFFDLRLREHYDWSYFTDATFVLLKPGREAEELNEVFDQYVALQNQSDPEWLISDFTSMPLPQLSQSDYLIDSSIAKGGHPAGTLGLGVIALLLLILACFNYMNISITSASKRLREIGLRKVMGGVKRQIIQQFLVENFLQITISVILGLFLAVYLFHPGFNHLVPMDISFSFSSWTTGLIFFGLLVLIVGLASGAYPAFYVSRFQPAAILRGNLKLSGNSWMSRILLGFQFFLAFKAIVGCFVFIENSVFMGNRDWGYDPNDVLVVQLSNSDQYQPLRNLLDDHEDVQNLSGADKQIGINSNSISFSHLNQLYRSFMYRVEPTYFESMGLRLEAGRFPAGASRSEVVINQTFARKLGWSEPLEQTFTIDSARYKVVGVVNDLIIRSPDRHFQPVMFMVDHNPVPHFLIIKSKPGAIDQVDQFIAKHWTEVAPYDPYERIFQEDVNDDFFTENQANISLMIFVSVLAITLACLGLFGLVSFSIQKRMKEFSVRKVLGASEVIIAKVASRPFLGVILISFGLGAPLGFFLIKQLIMAVYENPSDGGVMAILLTLFIMMTTIFVTLSGQILSIIRTNPAQTLRSE